MGSTNLVHVCGLTGVYRLCSVTLHKTGTECKGNLGIRLELGGHSRAAKDVETGVTPLSRSRINQAQKNFHCRN